MIVVIPITLIVLGLVLLTVGGEFLVRGSSGLAAALRISPLVIGLTVVAFGTSAPELAVTVLSSLRGETDLAVGNVVGSNIANVLFILGVSAMIAPLVVSSQLIRLDVPLMIASAVGVYLLALDGQLNRWDGALLFGSLCAYVAWTVRASRRETAAIKEEYREEFGGPEERAAKRVFLNFVLVVTGLVLLALGSDWLVRGAVTIARMLGVSELVIGLTIVAVGTSLPEAAASIVAAIRGERDIAVGNIVGSSIFNVLCVLGLTSLLSPRAIGVSETALAVDIPIMVAVAVACLPVFFVGQTIYRWNGVMFFGYYLAYLTDLVLRTLGLPLARNFQAVMLFFVIPLTAIALLIGVVRAFQASRAEMAPEEVPENESEGWIEGP